MVNKSVSQSIGPGANVGILIMPIMNMEKKIRGIPAKIEVIS